MVTFLNLLVILVQTGGTLTGSGNSCTKVSTSSGGQVVGPLIETGVPPLCHKKYYMCLTHRPRHLQPPASKFFYCFLSNKFEKSSTHREILVQSCRNMPCLLVRMVNWLVEFWCTRSRDSAPPIKSPKFSRNIVFIHKRQKKLKVALPHLFLKKVSEKQIIF